MCTEKAAGSMDSQQGASGGSLSASAARVGWRVAVRGCGAAAHLSSGRCGALEQALSRGAALGPKNLMCICIYIYI